MKKIAVFVSLLSGVCIVNAMDESLAQVKKNNTIPYVSSYSYGAPVPPSPEDYEGYLRVKFQVERNQTQKSKPPHAEKEEWLVP